MTKYRILDAPDLKPGKCANCGSCKKDGRKYVDFGLEVDWYGIVYLCGHCIHDIAKTMQASLVDKLETELKAMVEKAVTLEEVQEEGQQLFEKIVESFKEFNELYVGQFGATTTDSDSNSSPSVVSSETSGESGVNKTESGTTETKQRTTQSATGTGRKNVSSLAELLNNTK